MTEQVIYELGLRDKLTSGINTADAAVNKLEGSLFSVQKILTGIGIGLASIKLGEFVSEANEEWDKMEFAMSQVEAGIKSTGGAAGLTFEELKKGAEEASHNIKYTQSAILDMQSVLLTFPAVTKETFGQASEVITDMSTRLGTDLKSSAIQVGKALQDPVKGITALRRVGVNFNEQQTEVIQHLAETNKMAEAQALILQELKTEFGGSALAAAEADKSFRLDKTMEENKVILGEFIDQIKEELLPVLIKVANGFRDMIVWVKENWSTIKKITISLGAAFLAFKALTVVPAIFLAIENAAVAAAMGTGSLGASMTAALGPVGLLAAGIGALVYVYQDYLDMEQQHMANVANLNRSIVSQEEQGLDKMVEVYQKQGMAKEKAVARAKELTLQNIDNVTKETIAMSNAAAERGEDISSYQDKLSSLAMQQHAVAGYAGPKSLIKGKDGKAGEAAQVKEPKTKATGSKSITINVSIAKLGETHLNITNIKEGAKQLHDHVVAALTGAVNDFQVVANNS